MEGKPFLWHKLNRLHHLLLDISTEAALEGQYAMVTWADRVAEETIACIMDVRRDRHASTEAPRETEGVVPGESQAGRGTGQGL